MTRFSIALDAFLERMTRAFLTSIFPNESGGLVDLIPVPSRFAGQRAGQSAVRMSRAMPRMGGHYRYDRLPPEPPLKRWWNDLTGRKRRDTAPSRQPGRGR